MGKKVRKYKNVEIVLEPDGLYHGCHICTRYAEAGIRIRLEHIKDKNETKGHYIRMIINRSAAGVPEET